MLEILINNDIICVTQRGDDMEEINIKDLLSYFKSKIVFIILAIILIATLGILYRIFLVTPIYESSTSLILTGFSNSNEKDATINNNDLTINSKLLTTYQEITKSRKVLLEVIDTLELDCGVEELAENIRVTGVTDTEIIRITVSNRDKELAYKIVNEIATVFSDEVQSIYNVSNVSILDSPEVANTPSNITMTKAIFLSIGIGTVISLFVAFLAYYFDTTIKTVEQIEARVSVPVLGSIPDYTKKKKRGKK